MGLLQAIFFFLSIFVFQSSHAELYECLQSNGVTSYQGEPCSGEDISVDRMSGEKEQAQEPHKSSEPHKTADAARVCEAYANEKDKSDCYREFPSSPNNTEAEQPELKETVSYENMRYVASSHCIRVIERMAKWDLEWTDGWLSTKFQAQPLKTGDPDVISFYGDKLRLQNGFGAWSNMIYFCDINKTTGSLVDVRLEKGKL